MRTPEIPATERERIFGCENDIRSASHHPSIHRIELAAEASCRQWQLRVSDVTARDTPMPRAARVIALTAAAAVASAVAAAPGACPSGVLTACASDGSATCCPIFMSLSGYGCCHIPGGVCCPLSTTVQGCCPPATTCVPTGAYSATCVPSSGAANVSATQVCTPGARDPPSAALPSVIVVGDSVSEGWQPVLTRNVSASLFVQHSPWSTGGGADDVANGVNCVEEFLRTAMYAPAAWRGIAFNFGLHNLDAAPAAERAYEALLTNFTARLVATGSRLLYVATTPFMPDHWRGDTVVEDLNAAARRVMATAGVEYADLYAHVVARCGANYTSCSICDDEAALWPPGSPAGAKCGYHYTAEGYAYISQFLSPIFERAFA